MRYLKVIAIYFRLGVLNELEYRVNFFIQIFQTFLSLMVSIGGLSVVYSHTDTLNGWTSSELLAVIGVYFIFGGYINLVVQPSMNRFMEDVRMGTLDFLLLKPADAQLLVSVRQFQLWKALDIVLGFVILGVAVFQTGVATSPIQALGFVVSLLSGAVIVYSFWLILATMAFWFVRVDNILVIFESMYEAGRYPVGIYPGWLRFILTFLVPIAFAVTIPAEALIGRLELQNLLIGVVLAVVMLSAARWLWMFGIRNYTGASA
jgi:ABC-2 type transport system permease protein